MALRLLELVVTRTDVPSVEQMLADEPVIGFWTDEQQGGDAVFVRILLDAQDTEHLLDRFTQRFSGSDGFRMFLVPVEAVVPRPEPPAPADSPMLPETHVSTGRISREELYDDIADGAAVNSNFLLFVGLSSVVAAVGLIRGNTAIVIGAMLIAPLLGPIMALSLATTLADGKLARDAGRAFAAGIVLSLLIAWGTGMLLPVDITVPEIASRLTISYSDLLLAFAAGCAGALAFTTGMAASLIGVMVAVALLPPLVTWGMLIGAGFADAAQGAFLLFAANFICVNLAGVLVFLVKGIRPLSWWDAGRSRKATAYAVTLWTVLLAMLALIIAGGQ